MTNAEFYRNLIRAGLGVLALSYFPLSHAGYAQLSPPEGWSAGTGSSATYRYPSAANAASYTNGTVQTNAALRVNGQAVQVPARMRVAANAGRYAAAAIFLHPGLRTAAAVATWLGVAGFVYDVADGLWKRLDSDAHVSDGYEYSGNFAPNVWASGQSICASLAGSGAIQVSNLLASFSSGGGGPGCNWSGEEDGRLFQGRYPLNVRESSCPSGWYQTPAGCVQAPPMKTVTKEEFEQMVPDARPMPEELPGIIWPSTWPVEVPEIQPMFIPTGNPVPNPSYDPAKPTSPENQPYLQPGVKLNPAPMPGSPWQVDLQPVNRPVTSPNPSSGPVVEPVPIPGNPGSDKPRDPEKDERDLCEKNPEILACQKVDLDVENSEIPKSQKTVSYQAENIWGGGACPADKYARVGGQEIKVVDWSRDCGFVTDYVKPVALALSALIVAYILAGALKS